LPSYPTVRRYLKAQGMFRQAHPKRATEGALLARDRLERLEVRSFEVDQVSALWHLDFHHAKRKVLTRAGNWVKPLLLGVIDDRSRLVCHLQWYLDETAESLVHGLSQAFMKRGLPRALMTDNGAAMLADETVSGLACPGHCPSDDAALFPLPVCGAQKYVATNPAPRLVAGGRSNLRHISLRGSGSR
jgi:putative transposase